MRCRACTLPAPLVVMKFGGSAVEGAERIKHVARRLTSARAGGTRVVGVVSATGDTTDELLSLARAVSSAPDPRELDMLLTVGERIACALVAMAINDLGHEAVSLTGSQAGIVTDSVHGEARIVEVRARRILDALARDRIVLVAGFQGISPELDLTTLGRGGPDATAVALAAALGAQACEIYGSAAGVYTADPRLVPDARTLPRVAYDEALELSAAGAEVLQLRSIELARNHGVPVHVRSAFSDEAGTWITEEGMLEQTAIAGVAHTIEELVYGVEGVRPATLFAALAEAQVHVDTVIRTSRDGIVFSAPPGEREGSRAVLDRLGASWWERDDLGKVSLVGAATTSDPGVAAAAFETLERIHVEPELVSTSPITLALYVNRDDVEAAVAALHDALAPATADRVEADVER